MVRTFLLALLVSVVASLGSTRSFGAAADPLQCHTAPKGSVPELPAAVEAWVIVLCTSRGHLLAARVTGKNVVAWINHQTRLPYFVQALRDDQPWPEGLKTEEVRFKRFSWRDVDGEVKARVTRLWRIGFDQKVDDPTITRIIQLATKSTLNDRSFDIFFFLRGDRPRWIISCIDDCKRGAAVDVLEGDDLKQLGLMPK